MRAPWKRDVNTDKAAERDRPRVPVWVVEGLTKAAVVFVWAVFAFVVTVMAAFAAVALGMFAASRLGITAESSVAELILLWAPFTAVWVVAASRVAAKANSLVWRTLSDLRYRVIGETGYGC